jgi:putative endonuclease
MYYIYILYSSTLKKKYIGSTSNLRERLNRHNSGRSNFTSLGRPWKLIYYSAFLSKIDALREEIFLKSGQGRKRIKYLLTDTFQ